MVSPGHELWDSGAWASPLASSMVKWGHADIHFAGQLGEFLELEILGCI